MRFKSILSRRASAARNLAMLSLLFIFQLSSLSLLAQSKKVEGTVTDAKGLALEGASVSVKGTTTGVTTDSKGHYLLSAEDGSVLSFSYSGMLMREEKVGSRSVINVLLQENPAALENVVVVGYGTQKKVNLSGAVAQISGKDLANRPAPNVTGALQRLLPGLTVLRGSGKPGSEGYGIRIRGFTSANSAAALVLVDGVEQDLNLLDPSDVESITDAGGNGVYITTPVVSNENATVEIKSLVSNTTNIKTNITVITSIINIQGLKISEVRSSVAIDKHADQNIIQKITSIKNPKLWSPENPYLYTAETKSNEKGQVLDVTSNRFGFRWFSFDADKGFMLNGTPYKLVGASRHQDYKGLGNAVPDELAIKDVAPAERHGREFSTCGALPAISRRAESLRQPWTAGIS